MGTYGSERSRWPLPPLLLLLLLLNTMRARGHEQLDGSGAQKELDGDRKDSGLPPPWEILHWPTAIMYRSSQSSWKVPNTYLVVFLASQLKQMESIVHQLQAQAASQGFMVEVLHVFKDLFPGILMKTDTVGALDMVLRLRKVKYIEEDSFAFTQSLPWSPDQNSSLWNQSLNITWNMHSVSPELNQLKNSNHSNKESPVEVYLLGTGVRPNHREIKDRIIISNFESGPEEEWLSTSTSGTQEDNCESHGTHLAALVSGQSVGVAKDISIHSLRVLNCQGKGSVSSVLMGLEFIWKKLVSQPSKRMVVLLPLVSGYSQSLNNACKRLARAGAVLVAAAGNFQSNACAYSPASSPEVITVGAVDYENQPFTQGSLGTNYGSCVDIFAPGKRIVSASKDCNECYAMQSGTSQAAAHVAGITALMLTAQPNLTVAELRQRLIHYSIRNAINDTWFPEEERLMTPNLVAALPASTQETGGQLLCRSAWSAPSGLTLADPADAQCDQEEELLGCSSFSQSGKRQGQHVGILGKRRVCLAFGDSQVYAVARCCLLPRATCSVHTAPPALEGLKTYSHCRDPDQVLTGRAGPARQPNKPSVWSLVQDKSAMWLLARQETWPLASPAEPRVLTVQPIPKFHLQLRLPRAFSIATQVTVTCDAGWTLTSCSAHPENSVTLGAFPVDNMCVVRNWGAARRGRINSGYITAIAICCQIQPSSQQ
ncbi:proprotein convertase subtilisin/kexin type 9-like [Thomomys bottae]